ncbi:MAG: tripartite tricarboxylate transporter substrate binding protein [Hylemonella sp.]|nr:tripartite tricarboxylate transporter substrate binding protein [Hylemonella sp.]
MHTWLPTLGLVLAAALALPLQAQTAADKPVRIVVPFAAGGPTDVVARVLAPRLAAGLKRTVIVENRVGATGAIGAAYVAKSAPDGDTMLLGTSSIMAANPNLTASLPFDPVGDFTPISLVATVENILVVHPSVPVKSVKELVAYAKANPGKLSYASSGVGSTYHLGAEMFRSMTGIEWTHVPYKGAAPAIQDVLAGHVPVMFDNASSAIQNMKAGRVRALGVASLRRYPSLPELPTIAEEGLPGYETTIWIALFVPSKTPAAQVQLLNREVQAAVNSAEYKERLQGLDMQPRVSSPQELADYLKSDLAKWARVVKDAGIKPE